MNCETHDLAPVGHIQLLGVLGQLPPPLFLYELLRLQI